MQQVLQLSPRTTYESIKCSLFSLLPPRVSSLLAQLRKNAKLIFTLAVFVLPCSLVSAETAPIKHADGRIRYIVDLVDDDSDKPDRSSNATGIVAWKKAKSQRLIDDAVKLRGVELFSTTSYVGTSFTAYLTEKQVEQFSKDKRVERITRDVYIEPSAIPWDDTVYYGQVLPWGNQALGVNYAGSSNGIATVYILDTGVESHGDLTGLSPNDRLSALPGINPGGCYPHATHVAGIIGATWNNTGTAGVLPGVKLVSIAVGETNANPCYPGGAIDYAASGSTNFSATAFAKGLDQIYEMVLSNQRVGVVNISSNASDGFFASNGPVGVRMQRLATPTSFFPSNVAYPGAFIAQSAGNNNADACTYAYNAANAGDGIMVVGGLDWNGQRVAPMNNSTGFRQTPLPHIPDEPGSNYGGCVEAWAPSQRIYSTWTGGGYMKLSGTSMAAPYIAGFAARLLEANGGNYNSQTLEAAVRAHLTTIYGSYLAMPQLTTESLTAVPTIEVMEGSDSTLVAPINFNRLRSDVSLWFDSLGAAGCNVYVAKDGSYYSYIGTPPSYNINVSALPVGNYAWTVTCTSPAPASTQSSVTVYGTIRLPVTASWWSNTTSTNGWRPIANFETVTWSLNASFDQSYVSANAANCRVQSFGFHGSTRKNQEPGNPFVPLGDEPPYSEVLLWDSNNVGMHDTSYVFATLYFGDPHNSPYGIASYDGYKWRLTCVDATSSGSQTKIMYGTKAP